MDSPSGSKSKLDKLLSLVKGKKVSLITHWDADGISSGAIVYHLINDIADEVHTSSKGDVFSVTLDDVDEQHDIIICTDIQPADELPKEKVIYIDHHPHPDAGSFLFTVHNDECQSNSLLIWNELIPETDNPYFIFLALLGYFGDGGTKEALPKELLTKAMELMPEMMVERRSNYGNNRTYLEIQRYVAPLNTGKRMHWSGDLPLEMLKNIKHHDLFVNGIHPIADELNSYRKELGRLYRMNIDRIELPHIDYAVIKSNRNVQGVLCARHMNGKPILVLNRFNGNVIGSMRVPEDLDFDAGKFLNRFNGRIPTFLGGGHEKAGGFTFEQGHYEEFIKELESSG